MKRKTDNIAFKNHKMINFVNMNAGQSSMVRLWRNSKSVKAWMYQDHAISASEHKAFIKRLASDKKNSCWLVRSKSGEYIGVVALNKIDGHNKHAYLGIYANPVAKRPGMGSMLINAVKHAAFKVLKLHTLKLEVLNINEKASRFYLKHGFKKEGILKEYVNKKGRWIDVTVMGCKKT
ncbi:MAG: UDP-4-amino-4,6-dideoxy-N-acetyl-beta-L-altrosamine N-acetyltransferase [Endomicrobiales bacterium]|nr:UDP-4-amino-4,6-dideoxy-N-acetyl-beta-L-altrosamine N-acetyltransferase [Endomicrobiales bacterium]